MPSFIALRLTSAAAAVLGLVAAQHIVALIQTDSDGGTALSIAALLLVILGVLLAGILVGAPRHWWAMLLSTAAEGIEQLAQSVASRSRGALLVMAVAGIAFGLIIARFWPLQQSPWLDDQSAYLEQAELVWQWGGPLALLTRLFDGTYAEANRHPLFIALLALRPTFEFGKFLAVSIGALSLIIITIGVARHFGRAVAATLAVLLATNYAFCYSATQVTSEGLLTLLVSLVWLVSVSASGASSETTWLSRHQTVRWPLAGALLGLAYLTKGTALVLLAGYLGWLLLSAYQQSASDFPSASAPRRKQFVRQAAYSIALVILAWGLIASPLLVRNTLRFGQPLYNYNSYYLFTDQYLPPEQLADRTVGETAQQFFAEHSAGQLVERELRGLVWETFIVLRTLGPTPADDSRALVGLALLLFAVAGMLAERRRDALLILIWCGICVPLFAWYVPIAAGDRFVLPLVPLLLAYASAGLVRSGNLLVSRWRLQRKDRVGLAAAAAWCLAWVALTWLSSSLADRL